MRSCACLPSQYPAYAADIGGETGAALAALQTGPVYRQRYTAFMDAMVYGDRPSFDDAIATVRYLAGGLGRKADGRAGGFAPPVAPSQLLVFFLFFDMT